MTLTREAAWERLCEWTETDALRKHARAVEIVMRAAAQRYGAGEAEWIGKTKAVPDASGPAILS